MVAVEVGRGGGYSWGLLGDCYDACDEERLGEEDLRVGC